MLSRLLTIGKLGLSKQTNKMLRVVYVGTHLNANRQIYLLILSDLIFRILAIILFLVNIQSK